MRDNVCVSPCKKDPVRETPSQLFQFYLCFDRAFKQIYTSFSDLIKVICFNIYMQILYSI